jgi:hypothetical protein
MSTYGLEPQILVDGNAVAIIAGTWSFTPGYPEITTKTISNGRSSFEIYRTQDSSTAYSTFKFDIPATPGSIGLLQLWKERNGDLTIEANDVVNDKEVVLTFNEGSIDNNPDIESGNDAKISIEGTAQQLIQINI